MRVQIDYVIKLDVTDIDSDLIDQYAEATKSEIKTDPRVNSVILITTTDQVTKIMKTTTHYDQQGKFLCRFVDIL